MRRKLLLILSLIPFAGAVVVSEVSLNTQAHQLPRGYQAMLTESIVLLEHQGRGAVAFPLNLVGFGLAAIVVASWVAATLITGKGSRGFEVSESKKESYSASKTRV